MENDIVKIAPPGPSQLEVNGSLVSISVENAILSLIFIPHYSLPLYTGPFEIAVCTTSKDSGMILNKDNVIQKMQ